MNVAEEWRGSAVANDGVVSRTDISVWEMFAKVSTGRPVHGAGCDWLDVRARATIHQSQDVGQQRGVEG
jgi:hypothetical protein